MPKVRRCSPKSTYQNGHPLGHMSNRFEFLFSNSDWHRSYSCSETGPWSFYSYNDQRPIRNKKDKGPGARKAKQKCKQKIAVDYQTESVTEYISRTTARSSFIGFNKIATSKTTFGKIVWGVLTFSCLVGFIYQALKFAFVYQSLPTEVTLRVENNGTVEFPSVTVCNNNRIRKSQYCQRYPQECQSNPSVILPESKIFDAYFDSLNHVPEYKAKLGHPLDIVKGCIFKGIRQLNATECLKRFVPLFDPDYGNCFTFLSRDDTDGKYLAASEADFWHTSNDLILLFDIEAEEYTEEKRQPGLILTVHANEFSPDLHTDSIQVEAGSSYSFAVQQSITTLLPSPYLTNCTDFKTLPWISKLSIPSSRICTVECSRHFQFETCQYVTRNLSLFYEKLPWDITSITEGQRKCAADVEEKMKSYCRSLCGVPCVDVQFEVAVGRTDLKKTDLMELYSNEKEIDETWKDYVVAKVFYKTIERKVYEHGPMYDDMELFSYLGGYSGVWLGFSLLNLCEMLEIIVLSIRFAVSGCRMKKKINNAREQLRATDQNVAAVREPLHRNVFHKPMKITKKKKYNN